MIKHCYKYKIFFLCCCAFLITLELAATSKKTSFDKQSVQQQEQDITEQTKRLNHFAVPPDFVTFYVKDPKNYTEKIRIIEKEFAVNPDATLNIENKFGKVHIETWSENTMKFEVEIKVQDRSEDRAEQKLSEIDIHFDASSSMVSAFTEIDDGRANNGRRFKFSVGDLVTLFDNDSDKNKIEINYKVSIPESANLEIVNHYGNTYIDDINGNTYLDVKYGKLVADKLMGEENKIQVGYGHAEVEEVGNAEIEIKYSQLEIEKCERLELFSKYTNVEIEQVDYLDTEVRYGKLYIESVISFEGELKYTGLEIDELLNDLDLDISYGPKCEINYIPKEFEFIEIDGNFTSIHLDFENDTQLNVDAETSFGKIEVDHSLLSSYDIDRENNSEHLHSKGGGNSQKVNIDISYGNVVIDED